MENGSRFIPSSPQSSGGIDGAAEEGDPGVNPTKSWKNGHAADANKKVALMIAIMAWLLALSEMLRK
jgi:hypothetical protein